MARASTTTWLSLDRFAEIAGINPLHFNSVRTDLAPSAGCSDFFYQYSWQNHQSVSREDIARAISDVENIISSYVDYNLLPDWTADEKHRVERPYRPELYNLYNRNARGYFKSVILNKGHLISGGIKAKSVIQSGAAIVRSDADGDGYQETCTVTVATGTANSEIRIFHPGKSGADSWEIRPVIIASSGGIATITFKIWQIVKPNLWEALDSSSIDGDDTNNFETTVDIYRVYNDPQTQITLLWELPECSLCNGLSCTACQQSAQTGCMTVRDPRNGIASYVPADWNEDTESFDTASLVECREPDKLRTWYYSGWRDESRPLPSRDLDPQWERAIAYFAMALIDRDLCSCDSINVFARRWREDLTLISETKSFTVSTTVLDNPFGSWRGAVYAWNIANVSGRALKKS